MNNLKATPAQLALWHAITALVGGSAVSSGMAIFQYVSMHGVNVGQDVSYGLMVLLSAATLLPVSIYHLIQKSPALPQAEKDTEAQAQQVGEHVLRQLGPWFEAHFANVGKYLNNMEQSLANHAHVPASSVPQLPFQVTSASVPTTPPATSLTTGGVIQPGNITMLGKGSPEVMFPNPAANMTATTSMLNTFPLIPSVPKQ